MGEAILLVGTRKGLFVGRSHDGRRTWELGSIQFPMQAVYGVGIDTRRPTPRLFAGTMSEHWGPSLAYSDDLGRTWLEPPRAPVSFPADTGAALVRVWQIQPGPASAPDVVYAGVEPHALFRSQDGGVSYELVRGLFDHPHRPSWQPGFGGACMHTVVPHPTDPDRVHVALSAGGVYRTRDGGETWEPANKGIRAEFLPEGQQYPEYGQCVHKLARHPATPQRLWAQNHGGVYRSDDDGDSWQPVEQGLPATFGFPIVADPSHEGTVYVFPLVGAGERMPPERSCRLYRSDDGGGSWHPTSNGLPETGYHGVVLRDGLCADGGDPGGIYFGDRNGDVFGTAGDPDRWGLIASYLPDVLSLRAAVLD